ncbi:MAG TPA: chromosome segregation protein SMC [Gammaproteobacteria bacterium]|nr:chromosome segregation protein SMC [Gammaproteobacteria bacterium]
MRLSKIKLAGFKSFVDPTTIHVPSNLVGVIGPNGCGKSNIIDAVRWVMGESSAKHLRGESMSDVIFNGSTGRKPVGTASIELAFDNTDGTIGGQYAGYNEISIRRQVSRDGASNYFLNNTRCRRRDITDIFLGTGLGPRSYSIIEQGMISRLIEAKPDDLRAFLEEAAGISKYKERRRETENRIKHTRENLDRLNDLLEEIDKQLDKLKRQSRAAERYKELKAEERQVKAELLALRYASMHAESSSRENKLQQCELAMQAELAEQRRIEAELEKLRDSLHGANEAFSDVQGNYYQLGADVARIEQAIQHNKESRQQQQEELSRAEQTLADVEEHIRVDTTRLEELARDIEAIGPELASATERSGQSAAALKDAEQAMHAWQEEWNEFNQRAAERAQVAQVERTRLDHLDRHMQQLDDRLQRMDEEQQTLGDQSVAGELEQLAHASEAQETVVTGSKVNLDGAVRHITDVRSGLEQQEQELAALQSVHHDTRGQLASLETLQQAALGQRSEQVSGWLTAQGLQGAPRLAQEIQVEPGWEHAVETALGFYLEAVCVDGLDHVGQMLGSLEQGALALFDTGVTAGAHTPADRGVPLGSKVSSSWSLGALLDGIYAVETLTQALANRSGLAAHESIVTKDGIWVGNSWLRVARDTDEKAGVLEREREISELTAQLAAQLASVDTLLQSVAAARESLVTAEHERDRLQDEYNQALRKASELRAGLAAVQTRLEQQQARRDHVMMESEVLRTEKESEAQAMAGSQSLLQEALGAVEKLSVEREERTRQQQHLSRVLDETRERARSDQQTVHELALRAESMRTAQATTSQALTRMREQCQQLISRRDQLTGVLDQGDTPIVELQNELEVLLSSRHEVEAALNTARKQVEDIEHGTRELDQERIRKERSVSSRREQIEQERMAWQEIKVRSDTLLEQINESGFEYQPLLEQLEEDASVEVWSEQADKLERRIQRLGPINLAAIEEYEEESRRKEYLDAQHTDLTEALATLENAIGKIDRETRSRFKETFDQVNTGLQENFPALFGGGQAYLELTGDDLLDTGVTVMARPPGKRNSTIHLLSGGEKAMTAIALVFAIFRLNPSPFCMLDEVDAPLDDANVGRYCDMVRKMSQHVQFIFISHNKVTMEMANQLTGVTMHEPGVSRLVAVDIDEAVKLAAV